MNSQRCLAVEFVLCQFCFKTQQFLSSVYARHLTIMKRSAISTVMKPCASRQLSSLTSNMKKRPSLGKLPTEVKCEKKDKSKSTEVKIETQNNQARRQEYVYMKCTQPDCTYTEDTGAIANRLTFTNYYCIECGSGLEVAVDVLFFFCF